MRKKPYLTKEEKNFIKAWVELNRLKTVEISVDDRNYLKFDRLAWFWLPRHFKGLKKGKTYKYEELMNDEED